MQKKLLFFVLAAATALPALGQGASAADRDSSCHKNTPPIIRDGFPQPNYRYSRNGKLDMTLVAKRGKAEINGKKIWTRSYNGQFPGPMWMICAGDRVKVKLVNRLKALTNLHTHGFHISPRKNHDNVYVNLEPGHTFKYEYSIPRTNTPGSYWYHPHRHHYVNEQIFAGMAGGIVQEGGLDRHRALKDIPQRMIVLQNSQIKDGRIVSNAKSNAAKQTIFVNGDLYPTAKIRPGELQRWRIFNASADRIMVLRMAGRPFWVLAQDANILDRPRAIKNLKLAPGQRREVLVRGGKQGTYTLEAAPFRQFAGPVPAAQPFMFVRSQGRKVVHPKPIPRTLGRHREDLRKQKPQRYRKIVYSEGKVGKNFEFFINGKTFNPKEVVTMKMNALEQWTLVNTATEWHTFHIHINDFQVVSIAGTPQKYVNYQDNVLIPPKSSVVIRQKPTQFTGKFVFHCHVVFHEDHGMMAAVQVKKEPTSAELKSSTWQDQDFTVSSSGFGTNPARSDVLASTDSPDPGTGLPAFPVQSPHADANPFYCDLTRRL